MWAAIFVVLDLVRVYYNQKYTYRALLRIHEILLRIRMRTGIPGSIPLINGSGCGSCYFHKRSSRFFCLLLFDATFTSFFKDEKSKRSHKTVELKVFHPIFAPSTGSANSHPTCSPLQYTHNMSSNIHCSGSVQSLLQPEIYRAVLRIHEILVRIRIRIHLWLMGPDADPLHVIQYRQIT